MVIFVVGLADDAALARLHEGKEAGDDIGPGEIRLDFFAGLFDIEV